IFVIVGQLLFQRLAGFRLVDRFLAGKEDAGGDRKELPVVLHGVGFLVQEVLGLGVGVIAPDAAVVVAVRHQTGMISVQEFVQQDRVIGVLRHVRPQHDDANPGIGREVDDIGVGPLLLVVIPDRDAVGRRTAE